MFTNRPRKKTQTSLTPTKPAVWDITLVIRCSGILLWITVHLLFYNSPEMPWPWGTLILSLSLISSILLLQYARHWFAALSIKYPYFALVLGLVQGFLLTAVLFIPLFQMQATLWTVCLFILACLCLWVVHKIRTAHPGPLTTNHALFTPAGYALLKNILPAKKYGRCEFDLTGRDQLDCIYYDRCRYKSPLIPERTEAITKKKPNALSRGILIWILIALSLLIWPLLHKNSATPDPNTPDAVVLTH